jgi:ABC-type transporter Mla MlaB component
VSSETAAPEHVFGDRVSLLAGLVPQFTWHVSELPDGVRVELGGPLTIEEAPALWKRLTELLESSASKSRVQVDNSGITSLDGACTALLVHLRSELKARRVHCEFTGGSPAVRRLIELYGGRRRPKARRARRADNAVEQVGRATAAMFGELVSVLDFLGRLVRGVWFSLRHPGRLNWRDIGVTMERAGADAAPIVMLINFLIGFVMGYQSALQLKQFGANIYVADLVGLSVTRELGPLMTAIIVCGRTDRYLRRALERELFQRRGIRRTVSGPGATLDVELTAFEELRTPPARVRLALSFSLHDDRQSELERHVVVERPLPPSSSPPSAPDVAAALSLALAAAVQTVSDQVAQGLHAPVPEPCVAGEE